MTSVAVTVCTKHRDAVYLWTYSEGSRARCILLYTGHRLFRSAESCAVSWLCRRSATFRTALLSEY